MLSKDYSPVPFLRQLAAFIYDSLLIISFIIIEGFMFLTLNRGEAILAGNSLFYPLRCVVCATPFLFYAYFWSRQSQTLGMRAWRLVVVNQEGRPPNFWQALLRSLLAGLSLAPLVIAGYFCWRNPTLTAFFLLTLSALLTFYAGAGWRRLSPQKQTLYDLLARTRAYLVATNPYKHKKEK